MKVIIKNEATNAMRCEIERVDLEIKWVALGLTLGTSGIVVALAKKMAKPQTKTVTHNIPVRKTKIVKQATLQPTTPKDTEWTDFLPMRTQPHLPNQRDDKEKR